MPKKSLGQHWLFNPEVLQEVAIAANVLSTDTVLEIGPGLGTLSRVLLAQAKYVVAIELDKNLADRLERDFKQDSFEVIRADVMDFDLHHLPRGYKVAANIPYYLTSPIIMKLLLADNQPAAVALLIQKEVAQRLAAQPGELSVLGVAVQALAEVKLGSIVPAQLFTPPPKVDSQIVSIKPRAKPRFADHKTTMKLVQAGFLNRRKTLVNSLASTLSYPKAALTEAVKAAKLAPNVRAQELELADWVELEAIIKRI